MRILAGRTVVVILTLSVVLGACSDGASDEAIEEALARCEPVPQATVDLIASGLTISNGTLSNVAAVKSDSGPTLWIVAAQVNGDDFEGDQYIATWGVIDGIEVDPLKLALGLQADVDELRSLLADQRRERRLLQQTRKQKNRAIDAHRQTLVWTARTVEGYYMLAGEPELAERLRPATRRPSRPSEEPSEDTPSEDPSEDTSPPEVTSTEA